MILRPGSISKKFSSLVLPGVRLARSVAEALASYGKRPTLPELWRWLKVA